MFSWTFGASTNIIYLFISSLIRSTIACIIKIIYFALLFIAITYTIYYVNPQMTGMNPAGCRYECNVSSTNSSLG